MHSLVNRIFICLISLFTLSVYASPVRRDGSHGTHLLNVTFGFGTPEPSVAAAVSPFILKVKAEVETRLTPKTDKMLQEVYIASDGQFKLSCSTGSPEYTSWGMISEALSELKQDYDTLSRHGAEPNYKPVQYGVTFNGDLVARCWLRRDNDPLPPQSDVPTGDAVSV